MSRVLPITAVVPTLDRAEVFKKTLTSLSGQSSQPAQLIIIDGSQDNRTRAIVQEWAAIADSDCEVIYQRAAQLGAAAQRNQGVGVATWPFIWFFDDDVEFEPDCLARLWHELESDPQLGGVNAMITNQRYTTPGFFTRTLYRLLDGKSRASYAGRCVGPALNLLPEDGPNLPAVVPVEWLNTTCTIYRRESLPHPPFNSHFKGYSLMEDVALSLVVGRKWKLANARTARIYHDSQSAGCKEDKVGLSKMQLVNRHYVMTCVLGRNQLSDYVKLGLLETFGLLTPLIHLSAWKTFPAFLCGKAWAVGSLLRSRGKSATEGSVPASREPASPVEVAHR